MSLDTIEAIRLREGVSLEWAEAGEKTGEPVILLHGVTDTLISWRPFVEAMPAHFRVFAPTQRGHGGSSKPANGYRSIDFADDVAAFLEAHGLKRAHIVGHSMGGWVGLRLAERHPQRITSLTLIGAVQTLVGNPGGEQLAEQIFAMDGAVDPAFVRAFQADTMATIPSEELLNQAVAESLRTPPHVWCGTFSAFLHETPARPKRTLPTLLVYGERDSFLGSAERMRLASEFDAPGFLLYPELGHAPHWEQPARVAQDVSRFLASWTKGLRPQGCAA
jgi:pimeloyl-ACP methyl ester carboxylesterase